MAGFNVQKSLNTGVPREGHVGSWGWMINPDDHFLLIKRDKNLMAGEKNEYLCFNYCLEKG